MARRLRSFFFDNKKGKLFTGVNYTLKDIENEVEGTESIDGTKVSDFARSAIQTGAQPFLDNNTSILTAAATDNRINAVVNSVIDSAPGALDTLNELAAALGDDANFSTTVTNSIATKWTQDNTKISNWNTAYGWGNHASSGYLTGNQSITLSGDLTGSGTTTINAQIAANAIGITELNVTDGTNGQVLTTNGAGTLSFADAGNATTATTLQTSRTIALGGVLSGSASFDGSSNITITAAHTSDPVITLTGAVTGSGTMTNLGNVSIATTATADPTLTLAGDVTGSATFTNLGNATLTAVVADDSHNHIISNVDGLQTALDAKLASSSYTAADVLTKIKTVDGSNSGLDADLLDGQQGSYYTGYTDTAIANLVDSAPATLDTLNELAAALGDDPNFATTVTNSIATKLPSASYTAADVLTKIKTVDGTASGLDADLLDGQQGSYYAAASSLSSYLPLAGGTLTGGLTGTTGAFSTSIGIGAGVTLAESTDRADLLQITSSTSGWGGLQIRNSSNEGRWSFMTDGEVAGIYNDEDEQWHIQMTEVAGVGLYHAGAAKLATTAAGVTITGTATATTFSGALSGNATTATTLATARTINGVSFNGSANITVADSTKLPLTGGTMTGTFNLGNQKIQFPTGTGGSNFAANHYSMGIDIADGAWTNPNYSDLIIGYHTGIRIGGGYSGVRFYNNSPTTDANNDGNGDGGEALLMTIGGGGTATSGANVTINNSLYVGTNIYHNGDADTYLGFDTDTISLVTAGVAEVTINSTGVRLGDTGNGYFQPVTGTYGSIQIDGGAHGAWEGYSIGGRAVFMHDNANGTGLYNDVENEWLVYCVHNGAVSLYHNGVAKLATTATGVSVTGTVAATAFTGDGSGLTNAGISTGKSIAMAMIFGG